MTLPKPGEPIEIGEFLLGDYRFPAVYFLHDEDQIVYVGQSKTLKWRIEQHLTQGSKTFDAVAFAPCCVSRLLEVEAHYIRDLVPVYNQCPIAAKAREEDAFIPESGLRVVDGEIVVGSLGLSGMMNCSREFAKQLIRMSGKPRLNLADAFWCVANIKEPTAQDLARAA